MMFFPPSTHSSAKRADGINDGIAKDSGDGDLTKTPGDPSVQSAINSNNGVADGGSDPSQMSSFDDLLGAFELCCMHAQHASEQKRSSAAHGLFQTAVSLLQRVEQQTDGLQSSEATARIANAKIRLDTCARAVYPDGDGHRDMEDTRHFNGWLRQQSGEQTNK